MPDLEQEMAMPAAGLATIGEVLMAKVYSTVPGAVLRLGSYGEATNDSPVLMPDKAAAEFDGVDGFKVELDEPKAAKKAPKGGGK